MMAVRLRYSFRVNSRKVVSSRMGTLCSAGGGCQTWQAETVREGVLHPPAAVLHVQEACSMLLSGLTAKQRGSLATAHDEEATCEAQPSWAHSLLEHTAEAAHAAPGLHTADAQTKSQQLQTPPPGSTVDHGSLALLQKVPAP